MNDTPQGLPSGSALADEDGDAAVDADGDLGVASGAEHGAGAGVRVEQGDLLRGEGERGAEPLEVGGRMCEERERRLRDAFAAPGESQQRRT